MINRGRWGRSSGEGSSLSIEVGDNMLTMNARPIVSERVITTRDVFNRKLKLL